jgi:hypothetical protein
MGYVVEQAQLVSRLEREIGELRECLTRTHRDGLRRDEEVLALRAKLQQAEARAEERQTSLDEMHRAFARQGARARQDRAHRDRLSEALQGLLDCFMADVVKPPNEESEEWLCEHCNFELGDDPDKPDHSKHDATCEVGQALAALADAPEPEKKEK